jgi:uncharacterized FlaG/YvyC family protein
MKPLVRWIRGFSFPLNDGKIRVKEGVAGMRMKQEIAKKKAQDYIKETGLKLDNHVLDDGEFFIFGYDEEVDHPPVAVNKETGEVIVYFPPDHADAFLKAMTLPEPLFLTNPEWYKFDEVNFRYVLTEKATDEAKKSYEEYYSKLESNITEG